jgi:hypothetical protein
MIKLDITFFGLGCCQIYPIRLQQIQAKSIFLFCIFTVWYALAAPWEQDKLFALYNPASEISDSTLSTYGCIYALKCVYIHLYLDKAEPLISEWREYLLSANLLSPPLFCLITSRSFSLQLSMFLMCTIYNCFVLFRLSSPALRVPRAASPAAVEVDSIAYHKTLDEPPCSTAYTLVSRTGALATLIQFLHRKL